MIKTLVALGANIHLRAPNPDEGDREKNPTVLASDIFIGEPESWIPYGKAICGIDDELAPTLAMRPFL